MRKYEKLQTSEYHSMAVHLDAILIVEHREKK